MAAYLDLEACINQNFGAFVPGARVFGKWLFYYFDHHYSRLREIGGGTNQGALNCYLLKRIRLPLPKIERQQEVATVLDSIEELVNRRAEVLNRQLTLRRSLAHDLLTGAVRVKACLSQIAEAV
jgi:type I restriction enzyme S subunit